MSGKPIASSCIRGIAYRAECQLLQIEFADSGIYSYSGVPDAVYTALLNADSAGRFFNKMIRNCFPSSKGDGNLKTIRH